MDRDYERWEPNTWVIPDPRPEYDPAQMIDRLITWLGIIGAGLIVAACFVIAVVAVGGQ